MRRTAWERMAVEQLIRRALSDGAIAPAATGVVPSAAGGSAAENGHQKGSFQAGNSGAPRPRRRTKPRRTTPNDGGLNLRLALFPQTLLGVVERFVERNKHFLKWCAPIGWLFWDGKRWCSEGADDRVRIAVHETVRAIQDEADALANSPLDFKIKVTKVNAGEGTVDKILMASDYLSKFGRESEFRLSKIAEEASAYLSILPGKLDNDPLRFNVANGTLVINKKPCAGEDCVSFHAHNPDDLITKMSLVVYDPEAKCPTYDDFLARVQPDPENRGFLHRWGGLSLTGDVKEQKFAILWGNGRNGKSTYVDIVAHVAGDYSKTAPTETFFSTGHGRGAGDATPDLAMLEGVRHLRCSEPKDDRGATLDGALIKLAIGGEPIQARHLNRDYFEFYPAFKLTISGNRRPTIGSDDGIWGRVMLVPWNVKISDEERDLQLGDKLRREASGILNRLLHGLRTWVFLGGLAPPSDVIEATAAYRRSSDPLGRFLQENVVWAAGEQVQSSAMYEIYKAWAKRNGAPEWSNKGLSRALVDRGYERTYTNKSYFCDVKLVPRCRVL